MGEDARPREETVTAVLLKDEMTLKSRGPIESYYESLYGI